MNDAFWELYAGLEREGPGDRASLDRALGHARVKRDARILDAGCGSGADIEGLLAHAPDGKITAIEKHPPFVERARARFAGDARVEAHVGDMADPGGPYDLIWCSGALYFLGITEGLQIWRKALAPGGTVAFSELVWLTDERDADLETKWQAEYPAMGTIETLRNRITAAGYDILSVDTLADSAWEAYFTPMEARITALRPGAKPDMHAVLDEAEAEISGWRANRHLLGYALAVARAR